MTTLERVFHHYTKWEDWANGMYRFKGVSPCPSVVREVLGSPTTCRQSMHRVISEWPVATEQNLTNVSINRRAWLGRAAVNIHTGCPIGITKMGWHLLTLAQQAEANAIADSVIAAWEHSHRERNRCQSDFWD